MIQDLNIIISDYANLPRSQDNRNIFPSFFCVPDFHICRNVPGIDHEYADSTSFCFFLPAHKSLPKKARTEFVQQIEPQ